ncbi:hypothetical protein FGO68_gene4445 [Halteria grandinella]|uniref:EamA domain-containing protein n=1 Tax=Halteria grandinella TaxID=5974 RepID=A0A8J8NCM7_HALGN|nr:hypothetical protein FGO68_gene4445 [Halteria grandinella]
MVYISFKLLLEQSHIKAHEITYWQGWAVTLASFFILYRLESTQQPGKDIFYVPADVRFWFILRGICGFFANLSGPLSMKYIDLAKSTVLFYTNPIFIGCFGYFLLKERITNYDVGGIFCTFFGVVIFTMDPFGHDKNPKILEFMSQAWWLDLFGSAVALMGAVANAGAMMSIKRLGERLTF